MEGNDVTEDELIRITDNNSVISNFLNFSFVTNPFLNNICNYSIKKGDMKRDTWVLKFRTQVSLFSFAELLYNENIKRLA